MHETKHVELDIVKKFDHRRRNAKTVRQSLLAMDDIRRTKVNSEP